MKMGPRVKDLTGKVFGRLTVVQFLGTVSRGKGRGALWECYCKCGKTVNCGTSVLTRATGPMQSCGCRHINDLTGQTFGRLTVLRLLGTVPHGECTAAFYECQCSCGKIIQRKGYAFARGRTKSCGCLKRDKEQALIPTRVGRHLLTLAKCRAKKRGVIFNLTLEDIIIPEKCPIFGITLESGLGKGYRRYDNIPSLDRLDSDKGYIKGNVWVISWKANRLKNDATLEELELLVKGIKARMS